MHRDIDVLTYCQCKLDDKNKLRMFFVQLKKKKTRQQEDLHHVVVVSILYFIVYIF